MDSGGQITPGWITTRGGTSTPNGRTVADIVPIVALVLACIPILISCLSFRFIGTPADETNIAWLGKQVAAGRIPYRDFFAYLPPAAPVLAAIPARLFGAGLVPLRLLAGIFVGISTIVLYYLAKWHGNRRAWSFAIALWLPLVLFPQWPVASHHWFAMCFALGAILCLAGRPMRSFQAALGAVLTGLGGLVNQAIGMVLGVLLLIALFDRSVPGHARLAGLIGVMVPPAAFGIWLTAEGALQTGLQDFILFPMRHYRQQGGYNDVPLNEFFSVLASKLSHSFVGSDPIAGAGIFLLVVTAVLLVAWECVGSFRRRRAHRPMIVDTVALGLIGFGFSRARMDFLHLLLWTPLLLPIIARSAGANGRLQRALARVVLVAGLAVGLARIVPHWVSEPPSITRLLETDRRQANYVRSALLASLPGVLERNEAVVLLWWGASSVYLYWSPSYPPVDWIYAPSAGFTSLHDYARIVAFVESQRVPYLIVDRDMIDEFEAADTPIRDLLLKDFAYFLDTPYGAAYRRRN
jgi:4-amino-4-deoxy-L-arabinose transferase-like glycosyltransferase